MNQYPTDITRAELDLGFELCTIEALAPAPGEPSDTQAVVLLLRTGVRVLKVRAPDGQVKYSSQRKSAAGVWKPTAPPVLSADQAISTLQT